MDYEPFKLYLLDSDNTAYKGYHYSKGVNEQDGAAQQDVPTKLQKTNIYKDDTIENAKFKLVSQFSDNNIENYYFFARRKLKINVRELLNNNKKKDGYISYNTFVTILKNFNLEDIDYDIQNEYSVEEVNEKIGEFINTHVNVPLGVDNDIQRHDYVVNPLENTFNYSYLNVNETKSGLLFECGEFEENIIRCVHIEEYFKYVKSNVMLSLEDTMHMYYKPLHSKKVFSLDRVEKVQAGSG